MKRLLLLILLVLNFVLLQAQDVKFISVNGSISAKENVSFKRLPKLLVKDSLTTDTLATPTKWMVKLPKKLSKQQCQDSNFYIFFVPTIQNRVTAFLPLSGKYGYVLFDTTKTDVVEIERLQKSLSSYKYQWDLIHDPENMMFAWSQDESEGEARDIKIKRIGYSYFVGEEETIEKEKNLDGIIEDVAYVHREYIRPENNCILINSPNNTFDLDFIRPLTSVYSTELPGVTFDIGKTISSWKGYKLPTKNDFGDKTISLTIGYGRKNIATTLPQSVNLFYPSSDLNPHKTDEPNWFYYWKQEVLPSELLCSDGIKYNIRWIDNKDNIIQNELADANIVIVELFYTEDCNCSGGDECNGQFSIMHSEGKYRIRITSNAIKGEDGQERWGIEKFYTEIMHELEHFKIYLENWPGGIEVAELRYEHNKKYNSEWIKLHESKKGEKETWEEYEESLCRAKENNISFAKYNDLDWSYVEPEWKVRTPLNGKAQGENFKLPSTTIRIKSKK